MVRSVNEAYLILADQGPLTPTESYAAWTRADGSAFDPWIRTHLLMGGQILGTWSPPSGIDIDSSAERGRFVQTVCQHPPTVPPREE